MVKKKIYLIMDHLVRKCLKQNFSRKVLEENLKLNLLKNVLVNYYPETAVKGYF